MHGAGGAVPGGDGSLPALPGSPCLRPSAAVELGQAWPWPPHPAGERELSLELGVRCRSRGRGRGRDSPWAPVPVPHPPRCCRALGWDSAPEQAGSQVGGHTQTHTRSLAPAAQGLPHEPPPPGDWVCHSPRPAGTSPKGGGGILPHTRPPTEPCCPLQERGQEGATAAAQGRREGRGHPWRLLEPRPSLGTRCSCSPMATGAVPQPQWPWACCCPGCRGARGSCCCCTHPGAGRQQPEPRAQP